MPEYLAPGVYVEEISTDGYPIAKLEFSGVHMSVHPGQMLPPPQLVPLAAETGRRKPPEVVPAEARELDRWRLGADAGLDFALRGHADNL